MQVFRYQKKDGTVPVSEWLRSIRDKAMQARIRLRLQRLAAGNPGDFKSIGHGLSELRLHFGSGFRVYFAQRGSSLILLLCGGDKSTQQKDISTAKDYLQDWKERQK
jgi:putative addiction module killer protein